MTSVWHENLEESFEGAKQFVVTWENHVRKGRHLLLLQSPYVLATDSKHLIFRFIITSFTLLERYVSMHVLVNISYGTCGTLL